MYEPGKSLLMIEKMLLISVSGGLQWEEDIWCPVPSCEKDEKDGLKLHMKLLMSPSAFGVML